jgi:hypothetical protein
MLLDHRSPQASTWSNSGRYLTVPPAPSSAPLLSKTPDRGQPDRTDARSAIADLDGREQHVADHAAGCFDYGPPATPGRRWPRGGTPPGGLRFRARRKPRDALRGRPRRPRGRRNGCLRARMVLRGPDYAHDSRVPLVHRAIPGVSGARGGRRRGPRARSRSRGDLRGLQGARRPAP